MIWYSPNVFGKAWLGYVNPGGLPEHADMDKTPFVLSGLTALVTMYLLNQAQLYFAIVTVVDAIELAAVMSVFVMAQSIPNYVFGGKSLGQFLIEAMHGATNLIFGLALLVVSSA